MGNTTNLEGWSPLTSGDPNGNIDSAINLVEGELPGDVNNAGRAVMASAKRHAMDRGGALVAAGTADAMTLVTNQLLSAAHLAAGLFLAVRALGPNTIASPTLNVDGTGAKPIRRSDGTNVGVGAIRSGAMLLLFYNATGGGEFRAANLEPAATPEAFPSGTALVFVMATPPVGWTRQTTHHSKALRLVDPGQLAPPNILQFGGVQPFLTAFGGAATGGTVLDTTTIPSHFHGGLTGFGGPDHTHGQTGTHALNVAATTDVVNTNHTHHVWQTVSSNTGTGAANRVISLNPEGVGTFTETGTVTGPVLGIQHNHVVTFTAATVTLGGSTGGATAFSHQHGITAEGGGLAHSHPHDVRVLYVDCIYATKD